MNRLMVSCGYSSEVWRSSFVEQHITKSWMFRTALWLLLQSIGIPSKLTDMFKDLYTNTVSFLTGSSLAVESGKVASSLFLLPVDWILHRTNHRGFLGATLAVETFHRSRLCWWRRPSCRNARGSSAGSGRTEGRSLSFGPWSKLAEDKDPVYHWPSYCCVISSYIWQPRWCCGDLLMSTLLKVLLVGGYLVNVGSGLARYSVNYEDIQVDWLRWFYRRV